MAFSLQSTSLSTAKIVSESEMSRILARAKELSERNYIFFATALNTGLRVSEVLHIDRDDVQGDKLQVIRRKKKVLRPELIDLSDGFAPMLNAWASKVESGWIFPGRAKPCFINHRSGEVEQFCIGGHAHQRAVQRDWMLLLRELGIHVRGRGIHTCRHYAVTQIYKQTKDLRAAQVFAGHSSSVITERYAHAVDLKNQINSMKVML